MEIIVRKTPRPGTIEAPVCFEFGRVIFASGCAIKDGQIQPSSWPSRFRLIILGGNRQGLQVDRDKAVLFGDWREARRPSKIRELS